MATTHAKELVRDVFERGFGLGDLATVDAALAPTAVDRHSFAPDEPDMAHHLKAAIGMIRAAFPDLTATVVHLVQEGNVVAAHVELSGHHTGTPMFDLPAAGTPVIIEQFHVIEVDDEDLAVRHWANVGIEQMQAQLRQGSSIASV